jgi:hypothetical protein
MNYSYSLRIFWCCLWGIIFEGSKFQFRKNSVVPTCVRSLYKKKIIVACPTDKGDPGRLTIIANKCSIVRNAPFEWICIRSGAPTPAPSSSPIWAPPPPPVLPRHRTHVTLRRFVWRCTCEERVQGCRSSHNHSIGLDPVLVPCPDYGMAQVVEGRTQKEGENHSRLYFMCARNSVSSLLCLPNLS